MRKWSIYNHDYYPAFHWSAAVDWSACQAFASVVKPQLVRLRGKEFGHGLSICLV